VDSRGVSPDRPSPQRRIRGGRKKLRHDALVPGRQRASGRRFRCRLGSDPVGVLPKRRKALLRGVGAVVGEEVDEGDSTRVDEKEIVGVLLGVPLGVSLKLLEEDRLGVILGVREVLGVPLGDEPCDGVALGVFDRVEEVEGVGWLVFVKELGILFVTVPVGVAVGLGVAVVVVVGEKEGVSVS